ncbi:MAG: hypothetical protein LQ352_005314 [Teloschistes flavicans]|nr:MAG: hypothetical protein LQ352_005314 [Teloschistes flavicans]
MESKEYRIIGSEPVDDGELDNLYGPKYSRKVHCLSYIAPVLLALSLAANILLLVHRLVPNTLVSAPLRSTFAGLERNKRIAWTEDNDFASHNRTIWDQAWSTLNADRGFVAISDHVTRRKGLHESQRWPWDQSKGLYLLQSHHNLHCLLLLRTALVEMHDKKPQSKHFSHINHCLDGLRQDIMCNADDTPRYSETGANWNSGQMIILLAIKMTVAELQRSGKAFR